MRRTHCRSLGVVVLLLTGVLLSCSERSGSMLAPEDPLPTRPEVDLAIATCTVDVLAETMSCEAAPLEADGKVALPDVSLGSPFVRLRSSNVVKTPTQVSYDVTVQNQLAQWLGTANGVQATGFRVFFHSGPTAPVTVANADGRTRFTANNQPFFQYAGMLDVLESSAARNWVFNLNGATSFSFTVAVRTKLPNESSIVLYTGPVVETVAVSPALAEAVVGGGTQLAAVLRDAENNMITGPAVHWTSSAEGVATVDGTGMVTGVSAGVATITAKSQGKSGTAQVTVAPAAAAAFVTRWDTGLGAGTTVSLALAGSVNATIDWGDGTTQHVTTAGPHVHDYGTDGIRTVSVTGSVSAYNSFFNGGSASERAKLVSVEAWGAVGFTSMSSAFRQAANLTSVPATSAGLENVTNMNAMFSIATSFNGDIGGWNTANVTHMGLMFGQASSFNRDIGGWNTGNVTNMNGMFSHASSFNQNIGGWNTANVSDMSLMFVGASSFNQNVGAWDTGRVTDMHGMFSHASSFNRAIGGWDTGRVTDMNGMFFHASSFNQAIGGWNTADVTDMSTMFAFASSFNQNIGGWNTANVTNMGGMFSHASSFNGDIGGWDTGTVADMSSMFFHAPSFNQNIGDWNTGIVMNMEGMFSGASSFNQNIGGWDVANVTNMNSMFQGAAAFNQNLSDWCVSLPTAPFNFDLGATSWVLPRPVWGTCAVVEH
jgi:surface protein